MKAFASMVYEDMLAALRRCVDLSLADEIRIERCFQICCRYWTLVRNKLAVHRFACVEEEIDFFRNVKPLFLAEIGFYNLAYHAALFCPPDEELQKPFWEREALRLEKFALAHRGFYAYYKSGRRCRDHIYFVRNGRAGEEWAGLADFGSDPLSSSGYDGLVAALLALERYMEYVAGQGLKGRIRK